jgi:hypothetical protein
MLLEALTWIKENAMGGYKKAVPNTVTTLAHPSWVIAVEVRAPVHVLIQRITDRSTKLQKQALTYKAKLKDSAGRSKSPVSFGEAARRFRTLGRTP